MTVRLVTLDAMGTLVSLDPPAPRLRAALRGATGVDVGEEGAERAFAAEIAHYRAHHLRGASEPLLEELRDECAAVLHDALPDPGALARGSVREAMLDALSFTVHPDAVPALEALRARGVARVVVSNWDCSLPLVLERAGLADHLDAVVTSAGAGAAKPDPAPFVRALALAREEASEALHVGDSPDEDVAGARAAGMRAVLLDRSGGDAHVPSIASLGQLPSLL